MGMIRVSISSFFKKLIAKNKLLFLAMVITSAFASLDGVISPYVIGKITNADCKINLNTL